MWNIFCGICYFFRRHHPPTTISAMPIPDYAMVGEFCPVHIKMPAAAEGTLDAQSVIRSRRLIFIVGHF